MWGFFNENSQGQSIYNKRTEIQFYTSDYLSVKEDNYFFKINRKNDIDCR